MGSGLSPLALPQHPAQHSPERAILLAVDQPWKLVTVRPARSHNAPADRGGQRAALRGWKGALLVSSSKRISHARPRSC